MQRIFAVSAQKAEECSKKVWNYWLRDNNCYKLINEKMVISSKIRTDAEKC